jgi:hypothetical protein
MSLMGHRPTVYLRSFDGLLCEVKQPIKDVSAVTPNSNGGSCQERSFDCFPCVRLSSAEAV